MKAMVVLMVLMAGQVQAEGVDKNVKACVIHMVKDVGVPIDKAFDFCLKTYTGEEQ